MARNGRYKSKSDYTLLKNKHQNTDKGTIFETDYMTISKMDELFSTQKPIYSDGNFIFTERIGVTDKRRHTRYDWDGGVYTLDNLSTASTQSDESKIKIRPDYTTLKSFAYYGSATDLIKATINGVAKEFPAELYFSDEVVYIETVSQTGVTSTKYYEISNPFDINVYTKSINNNNVSNPLRYLYPNFTEYQLIDKKNDEYDITNVQITTYTGSTCEDYYYTDVKICDISITATNKQKDTKTCNLYLYSKNNEKVLLYNEDTYNNYRIRPKKETIENYFNSIDDFTYTLLNRRTLPIYTSKFYTTTFSDEKGFETTKKSYTWPTDSGCYNPLISDAEFDNYLSSLIELAEYYDEYESNNVWRSMTHEAIKNLDWTFASDTRDAIEGDLSPLNTTKIEAICKLYGRLFDEIKLYIDGIKNSNTITYNGNNNAPDYALTDILETMGWKPKALTLELKDEVKTNRLYPSENIGYTASDANTSFLRRLILNSAYLLSLKGTRAGIDTLMALFGYDNNEYSVMEYVYVDNPTGKSDIKTFETISNYNKQKDTYYLKSKNGEDIDEFDGLPLNYAETTGGTYVFPWFDKSLKYDSGIYFQSKGGWENEDSKTVNAENSSATTISGDFIYNETKPIIKFVTKLSELLDIDKTTLNDGDICYVNDVTNIKTYYNAKSGEDVTSTASTHYFKIENKNFSNVIGYNTENSTYGWKMIYTTATTDYNKVLYLESIKDDTEGNNPHIGNGRYDNGAEYITNLEYPFKKAVEDGKFSTSSEKDKIKELEFSLTQQIDNRKCWYFTDNSYYGKMYSTVKYEICPNTTYAEISGIDEITQYGYYFKICSDKDGNYLQINNKQDEMVEFWGVGYDIYIMLKQDKKTFFNGTISDERYSDIIELSTFDTNKPISFTLYGNLNGMDDTIFGKGTFYIKLCQTKCQTQEYGTNFKDSNYSIDYSGTNNESSISPYNYEATLGVNNQNYNYEEGAANSVVNVKNVDIKFNYSHGDDEKNFINNIVRYYLKEMIPSTSITKISFEKNG